jgi:hypothetical protein
MVAGLETLEPFVSQTPELGAIFTNGLPVEALDPRAAPPSATAGGPDYRRVAGPSSSS